MEAGTMGHPTCPLHVRRSTEGVSGPDDQTSDYNGLKKEVMHRYVYTLMNQSQRFNDWTASPLLQMHDLIRLAH